MLLSHRGAPSVLGPVVESSSGSNYTANGPPRESRYAARPQRARRPESPCGAERGPALRHALPSESQRAAARCRGGVAIRSRGGSPRVAGGGGVAMRIRRGSPCGAIGDRRVPPRIAMRRRVCAFPTFEPPQTLEKRTLEVQGRLDESTSEKGNQPAKDGQPEPNSQPRTNEHRTGRTLMPQPCCDAPPRAQWPQRRRTKREQPSSCRRRQRAAGQTAATHLQRTHRAARWQCSQRP